MNPENHDVCDRSQTDKVVGWMTPFIRNSQNGRSHGDGEQRLPARGRAWGVTAHGAQGLHVGR